MSEESAKAWYDVVGDSRRDDLSVSVTSAIESCKSLPWKYAAVVPLPFTASLAPYFGLGASYGRGEIGQLTDDQRRRFDEIKSFTLPVGEERDLDVTNSWLSDRFYLIAKFSGYIPSEAEFHRDASVVLAARDELKSVLGLCIACDLLTVEQYAGRLTEPLVVFRETSNAPGLVFWLPDDDNTVIRKITEMLPEGAVAAANFRRQWHAVTAALRRPDDRLLNAARWLFGSYAGSNELLQLVQAAVTLEILLGDNKNDPNELRVSSLLANRAAYLIATSRSNRDELLDEVKQIYAARSRIVHSGGNKLGNDADKRNLSTTLRHVRAFN